MALLAASRRLPVLRDLSVLAVRCDSTAVGAGLFLRWSSSSTSSTSGNNTDGVGASSSDKDAAGDSAKTTPAEHPSDTATSGQSTAAAIPEQTSQPTTVNDDEEWTEVVHSSGRIYYWNQRTGETTQLGEPKPQGRKEGTGGGGWSGGGSSAGGAAGAGASTGQGYDPRAEAPLEDRTGTYASVGVLVGAFLGWVSQFV